MRKKGSPDNSEAILDDDLFTIERAEFRDINGLINNDISSLRHTKTEGFDKSEDADEQ